MTDTINQRRHRPLSPEAWRARHAARERLAHQTDEALRAGLDAWHRGEDPDRAMAARQCELAEEEAAAAVSPRAVAALDGAFGRLRADGWTPARQRLFLVQLAATGCVTHACAAVGLSKQSAYALRRRAPWSGFSIGWDVAIRMARQALYDEALERAHAGRREEIWYHGEHRGTRIVHNDRLLMFLLDHDPGPAHPVLSQAELHQLWPQLLAISDVILPPAVTPERLAELQLDPGAFGNDAA